MLNDITSQPVISCIHLTLGGVFLLLFVCRHYYFNYTQDISPGNTLDDNEKNDIIQFSIDLAV